MKTQTHFLHSLRISAAISALPLLIVWLLMQVTDDVRWSGSDFLLAGSLLFAASMAYQWIAAQSAQIVYRLAALSAVFSTLFLVWANLAVGLIGAGPNAGNLMYIAIPLIGIVGAVTSHFRAIGMAVTLWAMAAGVGLIAVIALASGMQHYPGSSSQEILLVNGFFATLFFLSGLLFFAHAKMYPAKS